LVNQQNQKPRVVAAIIISKLLNQQGSLASLLPEYRQGFSDQDQSFIKELTYGCCRWYTQLDALLNKLLKQPLKKKDADIKAVILLGFYQLQFLATAEYAAINESVNAAQALKKTWAKKLINGVLRKFQREKETLFYQAQKQALSAHPRWLEKQINSAWPKQAQEIFQANNQHPPMTLRVNQSKHSREEYLEKLREEKIEYYPTTFSSVGFYLKTPLPVTQLPLFNEGAVSVQDESPQLCVELLDLQPGLKVLDACSAPGGKTCHIAETEPNLERLVALDVEERRLLKVSENLQRLSLQAETICADAVQTESWWDGQAFDRILLDAPCSATGIIRRQPDIKILRKPEHINELSHLQQQLLEALWPLLTDGGILLYATCSIMPQENTQVVQRFVEKTDDCHHLPIEADWGIQQDYGRQILPGDGQQLSMCKQESEIKKYGCDGFFYARLQKRIKTK
jgi:16S rRNA (cytosine967-C5)-methyltransferase